VDVIETRHGCCSCHCIFNYSHGTGECNYRSNEDFRLSFAVYVADINDQNIDLIASSDTLWPTTSGSDKRSWFEAQKGRVWTKDGTNSLLHDKGRLPMNIQDNDVTACSTMNKDSCMTDLQGMRLQCPKTCELYLEDDIYYAKYFPNNKSNDENVDGNGDGDL
jgi:hypothetical protein